MLYQGFSVWRSPFSSVIDLYRGKNYSEMTLADAEGCTETFISA